MPSERCPLEQAVRFSHRSMMKLPGICFVHSSIHIYGESGSHESLRIKFQLEISRPPKQLHRVSQPCGAFSLYRRPRQRAAVAHCTSSTISAARLAAIESGVFPRLWCPRGGRRDFSLPRSILPDMLFHMVSQRSNLAIVWRILLYTHWPGADRHPRACVPPYAG